MKLYKLYLKISVVLFFVTNIFGQAVIDIPFSATDGTFIYQLSVGLDLTATNGIDIQLGEYTLPSPPTGVFTIAFDLYPYTGQSWWTFKDYRAPGNPPIFPFTGIIEHTLLWTWTITSIDIIYNLPYGTIMWLTDQFGGIILNLGPFSGQGTVIIPETYNNLFNTALVKMHYDNIVPVELTSFTTSVLQNENAVRLNWTTATETNNSGIEIHRFTQNDNEWKTVGFVPGFGTTTEPKSYSFTDENVTTGIYKYRLKQIDFDGSFNFSNEIEVEVDFTPKEFVLYQNYPNPFNPTTNISYSITKDGLVTLKVYDILGTEVADLVNEVKEAGDFSVTFNASELPSGIYFYTLTSDNFMSTKKLILLK